MDTQLLVVLGVVALILVAAGLIFVRARRSGGATVDRALTGRLAKTAASLGAALRGAWGSGLDNSAWVGIEEALIAADMGVESSSEIVAAVRAEKPATAGEAKQLLTSRLLAELDGKNRDLGHGSAPSVILVVGVNGTGKTTTIAKLGSRLGSEGKSVLLAAADTFRAAAGEQLKAWGSRIGIDVVGGQEGGDPAAVVFDALASARSKGTDVVIVDTAGRLHDKKNLMAELSKIHRVADGDGGLVDEVLLVLDATAGQNGLTQVSAFSEAVPVSGIVLTKLDGTARGGIVLAIERRLGVPVKFVGIGEGVDDLEPFDPNSFVTELLEQA